MKRIWLPPAVAILALALVQLSCDSRESDSTSQEDDGQVVRDGRDLRDDPQVLSPPILDQPIYECTEHVFVSGFIPQAQVLVFADANPNPIGQIQSIYSNGQSVKVNVVLK